jgi:hypothetical protein
MPEAAVHENHLAQSRENKIGRAGKVGPMKPEAIAKLVRKAPHDKLWLGIHFADAPHVGAALFRRQSIRHRKVQPTQE